eukprot:TRINITY_DN103360_c0_g1_i1.p1 TRINITY_DN103360_c0_g1~~TRINITY_DN103360_c0_g1_i1.p1  ORF type:complete len:408 (-),score=31.02 TRINITY_DN103360_c0_g1_i1:38-1126(-)
MDDNVATIMSHVHGAIQGVRDSLNGIEKCFNQEMSLLKKTIQQLTNNEKQETAKIKQNVQQARLADKQEKVKLNVRGQVFNVALSHLVSPRNPKVAEDTFFTAMLSSESGWAPDNQETGEYYLDRDPLLFQHVLNYLSDPNSDTSSVPSCQQEGFSAELDFYSVSRPHISVSLSLGQDFGSHIPLTGGQLEWLHEHVFRGNKPTLLYRSTGRQFSAAAFHKKCDRAGSTITLIKQGPNIAGAYASRSWVREYSAHWKTAPLSFLFCLEPNEPHGHKWPLRSQTAHVMRCIRENGPTFGDDRCGSAEFCVTHDGQVWARQGLDFGCGARLFDAGGQVMDIMEVYSPQPVSWWRTNWATQFFAL